MKTTHCLVTMWMFVLMRFHHLGVHGETKACKILLVGPWSQKSFRNHLTHHVLGDFLCLCFFVFTFE